MRRNLFLSHAWATDTHGRNTHERVRQLKDELRRYGYTVFFDEDRIFLGSNIDAAISEGIKQADAVIVCLTRAYIDKVNSQKRTDYCSLEFNMAQRCGKAVLPLVFERELLDKSTWKTGVLTMYLGGTLYLDATGDMKLVAAKLSQMLRLASVMPSTRPQTSRPGAFRPLLTSRPSARLRKTIWI